MQKKNILIIGGGNAGINVARSLSTELPSQEFELTLVTERKYHIHYPALLRVLVSEEGGFQELAFNSYDKLFKPGNPGRIVTGTVVNLADGLATLADGHQLPYDWLVLATGTKWEGSLRFPLDKEAAFDWIQTWRTRFEESRNIVLIGGGAIGLELSGEIRHAYPNKKVTIVHAGSELLNEAYPAKLREHALRMVQSLGVDVLLDDRLGMPSSAKYERVVTLNNVSLDADLVVPTRGGTPDTAFLRSFDPTILNYVGRVKVLPTLRVPLANGKENVYACGDIIDWDEQKMLAKSYPHASVIATNLLAAIKGQPPKKRYTGLVEAVCIPFGPHKGFTYIPFLGGIIIGSWITRILKSERLNVNLSRKALNIE